MSQQTPEPDNSRFAHIALLFFTVVVAAVTFVLSFHGLSDYGARVAGIGGLMSWLVPIGVDGLTLCAVAATFLLRHSQFHVRAYAWAVFGVAVAASVAGNVSHAESRHLAWDGQVGAAAWPVLLALASHLVIVTRRALEQPRRVGQPTTAEPGVVPASTVVPASSAVPASTAVPSQRRPGTGSAGTRAAGAGVAAQGPTVETPKPAPRQRPAGKATAGSRDGDLRAKARRMYAEGRTYPEIAIAVGRDKRTVQRWMQDARRAADATGAGPAAGDDAAEGPARAVAAG